MSSNFRAGQYLEWCTQLPPAHSMRESPIFLLEGKEFFLRFIRAFIGHECYSVYLMIKDKKANFKPCRFNFQVGFKYEKNLILQEDEFEVSHAVQVWYILEGELRPMLPPDYLNGNWIKLVFRFDNVSDPLLKINNSTEKQPKDVGSQVFQDRQTPSDLRKNIHFEALSRDFSRLLEESSNCDAEITCEDKTIKAHRIVLETRSKVFSAMLKRNYMIEGKSGLIILKNIKASTLRSFLRYLYSGMLPELSMDVAKKLYEAGDKYAVEELKTACSEFLTKNMYVGNACELLVFADQHSDEHFRKNVMSFIVNEKIPKLDTHWSNFNKKYPSLALEVSNLYIQKY